MKIKLEAEEVLQLLEIGLMSEKSPIIVAADYTATNLKITQKGEASFDLVSPETEGEDDD